MTVVDYNDYEPVFPMCPTCLVADVEVRMARDVRDPCPHCGGILIESLRVCCLPGCRATVPASEKMPVCEPCGIKIASVFASAAAIHRPDVRDRIRAREAAAAARKAELAASATVYYVRLDDERIKIGYTGQLRSRLAALRAHPSALLAAEPGGREVEKARHEQFGAERITRKLEEFHPSPRLLEWIASVRSEHGIPAWANVPDTRVKVRR